MLGHFRKHLWVIFNKSTYCSSCFFPVRSAKAHSSNWSHSSLLDKNVWVCVTSCHCLPDTTPGYLRPFHPLTARPFSLLWVGQLPYVDNHMHRFSSDSRCLSRPTSVHNLYLCLGVLQLSWLLSVLNYGLPVCRIMPAGLAVLPWNVLDTILKMRRSWHTLFSPRNVSVDRQAWPQKQPDEGDMP